MALVFSFDVLMVRVLVPQAFLRKEAALSNWKLWPLKQALLMPSTPPLILETDCKVLVDVLNDQLSPPWSISSIVADILYLKSLCNIVSFGFCYREVNKAAHWAANRARICKDVLIWSSVRPPELESILYDDRFGPGFSR